jgi:phage host-nuclease inhibitor protein Gam
MSAPLYAMAGDYAVLQQLAEDGQDVSAQLEQLAGAIEQKTAAMVRIARDLELDVDKLDDELRRLTARKRALVANRDRIRDYMRTAMETANIDRVKAAAFTVTLSAPSAQRVEVVDESLVPDTYVRVKREVNKAAVLDAYRVTGEIVPGCTIVDSARALTIK